jgi:hypothetical protein
MKAVGGSGCNARRLSTGRSIRAWGALCRNAHAQSVGTRHAAFEVYHAADPAEIATPDRSRFHDAAYRPQLRKMVDHVVAVEGPVYFDVLVDRISRAHGFQRAKGMIRDTVASALWSGPLSTHSGRRQRVDMASRRGHERGTLMARSRHSRPSRDPSRRACKPRQTARWRRP